MSRHEDVTEELDAACAPVRDHLMRHFATIEARIRASPERRLELPLHATNAAAATGTKPLEILTADDNRTFVLKRAEPPLLAAEECAAELRTLGGRPVIPAVRALVTVDGEERAGLLKPYLDLNCGQLAAETSSWTPLQRAVLLREHAWEHLLENLDTNMTNYALIGPDALPVNVDWDRSFAVDPGDSISRFIKYRPLLPNARTFLYADYVEGRIDLPLATLQREAKRVRALPNEPVRAALARYAVVRFGADADAARAFVERIMRRKQRLDADVARFISALHEERMRLASPRTRAARIERWFKHVWDRWQVLLHVAGIGPLGRAGRKLLKVVRGRRLRALPRAG